MNPASSAPKNKPFLADLGFQYLIPCVWNDYDKTWCYVVVNEFLTKNKQVETLFEVQRDRKSALIGWLPIPKIDEIQDTKKSKSRKGVSEKKKCVS